VILIPVPRLADKSLGVALLHLLAQVEDRGRVYLPDPGKK